MPISDIDSGRAEKYTVQKKILLWTILAAFVLVPFLLFEEEFARIAQRTLEASRGNVHLSALVLFLLLASDILLPVPSCIASTACGSILGAPYGFLVSFAAMTASSAIGYALGRLSSGFARSLAGESLARAESAGKRVGPVFLLLMRPVPVLAESSVIYAGICRYSIASSALWIVIGNAAVSAFYAIAGSFAAVFGGV